MSKSNQMNACSSTQTSIVISNVWSSHRFVAPNEYSPVTIGIHNCVLRPYENEHFSKFFYHENRFTTRLEHFCKDLVRQLDENEKNLTAKFQTDIERCIISARLRQYLEQNEQSFPDVLTQIYNFVYQRMREDEPLTRPKTIIEFQQRCAQQNINAIRLQQVYRKERFQYHHDTSVQSSINIINLQNQIQANFDTFLHILPKIPTQPELFQHFQTLLNNSFFIIQEPSPPIATHSPTTRDPVIAKIHCRIVCLLDSNNPAITLDAIIPRVRRISTLSHSEEPSFICEQSKLNWSPCTIVTASNKQRSFQVADLSEIHLRQTPKESENTRSSSAKPRYSPYIYCIDFAINVKVRFPGSSTEYQHCVIVQSAPFGLVTNTKQADDVFAKLFIQDLKSWRGLSMQTNNLTIEDIIHSIAGYFIRKTGVYPKEWVIPYISKLLKSTCRNLSDPVETLCHNMLVKIISQIDYMAEHPVLSLLHADGLFLGICDSDDVNRILLEEQTRHEGSICAIRFGELTRMSDAKDIGLRIELVERSSSNILRFKFDTNQLQFGIGLFIIKIASCTSSYICNVLTKLDKNCAITSRSNVENVSKFKLYDSEKLRELCPDSEKYPSIWHYYYNKENQRPNNIDSTISTPTENIDQNDMAYELFFPSEQASQPSSDQLSHENYSHTPQTYMPPQPSPVVIVITHPNNYLMSHEEVISTISQSLPQHVSSPNLSVYRIDLNTMPPVPSCEGNEQANEF